MRTALLAASVALAASLLSACECGAFEGQGDRMLRHGDDSMMLCSNGGFALTTGAGVVEGRYGTGYDTTTRLRMAGGETGMVALTMTTADQTSYASPELGEAWELATLDKYELDHAHVQCSDLETRAWWTSSGFPQAHYYQLAGASAQLLLCPNRAARLVEAGVTVEGSYGYLNAGELTVLDAAQQDLIIGQAREDGTFVGFRHGRDETWNELPLADSHDLGQCD